MSGLEIIAAAASIIQVADAGLRLSKTIHAYADSVSSADLRLTRIANHVELTSRVVQDIGLLFQIEDTSKLVSASAVSTANETSKECERIFEELRGAVGKCRNKKWRFPFKEQKLDLLNAHLEQLKSVLSLLLNVLLHGRMLHNDQAPNRSKIAELVRERDEATAKYEQLKKVYDQAEHQLPTRKTTTISRAAPQLPSHSENSLESESSVNSSQSITFVQIPPPPPLPPPPPRHLLPAPPPPPSLFVSQPWHKQHFLQAQQWPAPVMKPPDQYQTTSAYPSLQPTRLSIPALRDCLIHVTSLMEEIKLLQRVLLETPENVSNAHLRVWQTYQTTCAFLDEHLRMDSAFTHEAIDTFSPVPSEGRMSATHLPSPGNAVLPSIMSTLDHTLRSHSTSEPPMLFQFDDVRSLLQGPLLQNTEKSSVKVGTDWNAVENSFARPAQPQQEDISQGWQPHHSGYAQNFGFTDQSQSDAIRPAAISQQSLLPSTKKRHGFQQCFHHPSPHSARNQYHTDYFSKPRANTASIGDLPMAARELVPLPGSKRKRSRWKSEDDMGDKQNDARETKRTRLPHIEVEHNYSEFMNVEFKRLSATIPPLLELSSEAAGVAQNQNEVTATMDYRRCLEGENDMGLMDDAISIACPREAEGAIVTDNGNCDDTVDELLREWTTAYK